MNRFSVLLGAVALFSVAHAARPSYTFRYSTTHYVCQGGQRLDVTLISTLQSAAPQKSGPAGITPAPLFALLTYQGQQYGLAQALSGSGARYASLYGPTPGGAGLEWWEHQGEGTLSKFIGNAAGSTVPLLRSCRVS